MASELEGIISLLKRSEHVMDITTSPLHPDDLLERVITFKVNRVEYRIEWWCNLSYIYLGEFFTLFDSLKMWRTWPNGRLNVHFLLKSEIVAILPIDKETNNHE